MKQRVAEMEQEAIKLRELQAAAAMETTGEEDTRMETEEEKNMADVRSIYVGNVDYGATPEEIQVHFQACGTINRVTILCDKFTGHPKGHVPSLVLISPSLFYSFAYVEFAEPEHIETALTMDNSLFRGRLIKVLIFHSFSSSCVMNSAGNGKADEHTWIQSRTWSRYVSWGLSWGLPRRYVTWFASLSCASYVLQGMAVTVHTGGAVEGEAAVFESVLNLLTRCTTFVNTLPSRLLLATTMFAVFRGACRSMSTAYPFSKTALVLPEPAVAPPAALKLGKGLMPYLSTSLPTLEKQQMLRHFFSRQSRTQLYPGSIITVTLDHAPTTFTGVLLAIRRRGQDTSFVVRNIIQRTGVEMQFFVNSPHLKEIKVLQRPPKGRLRRAKLYYLRDSPDKMSTLATKLQ
ncbi:hypothetical protein C8F01DRAFT_1017105 [Mycena amicta]|nr:hypothetical protein C8F01DRAFT_1017105 [Mycena amicta]